MNHLLSPLPESHTNHLSATQFVPDWSQGSRDSVGTENGFHEILVPPQTRPPRASQLRALQAPP